MAKTCSTCGGKAVYKDDYDNLCAECAHTKGSTKVGAIEETLMLLSFAVSRLTMELTNDEIREALDAILADEQGRGEGEYSTSAVYGSLHAVKVARSGWVTGMSSLLPRRLEVAA